MHRAISLPTIALLCVALLATGCSREGDGAIGPFAEAAASLGLLGMTYGRASVEKDRLRIFGVKGTLDAGEVEIGEIVANGFSVAEGRWSAASIDASRVTGAVSADEITLTGASGPVGGARGTATHGPLRIKGYHARLLGHAVRFGSVEFASGTEGAAIAFERLRIVEPKAAPPPLRALLGERDWDGNAWARPDAKGGLTLSVRDLRSSLGTVTGSLSLIPRVAGTVVAIPGLGPMATDSLESWADGASVTELSVDANLADAELRRVPPPDPAEHADPAMALRIGRIAAMMGAGRLAERVVLRPSPAVPLRSLPEGLRFHGASRTLGLATGGAPGAEAPQARGGAPRAGATPP